MIAISTSEGPEQRIVLYTRLPKPWLSQPIIHSVGPTRFCNASQHAWPLSFSPLLWKREQLHPATKVLMRSSCLISWVIKSGTDSPCSQTLGGIVFSIRQTWLEKSPCRDIFHTEMCKECLWTCSYPCMLASRPACTSFSNRSLMHVCRGVAAQENENVVVGLTSKDSLPDCLHSLQHKTS